MAQWQCKACTFLNHRAAPSCEICSSPCPSVSTSLELIEIVDLVHELKDQIPSPVQEWEAAFHKSLHGLSPASHKELIACLENGRATGQAVERLLEPLLALGWHICDDAMVMPAKDGQQRSVKASTLLFYSSLEAMQQQREKETSARIQHAQSTTVLIDDDDSDQDLDGSISRRVKSRRVGPKAVTAADVTVHVRLFLPDGTKLTMPLDGDLELIYLLVVPDVQKRLCAFLGLPEEALSAQQLAKRFSLVGPPPDGTVYHGPLLQRAKILEVLLGTNGVIHVQLCKSEGFQIGAPSTLDTKDVCERIVVIRLRTVATDQHVARRYHEHVPIGAEIGSPVLLFKNYNLDRGLSLMKEIGITTHRIPGPQAHHSTATVSNPLVVQHHGEAVLKLCRELLVVKSDQMALRAFDAPQEQSNPWYHGRRNHAAYGWHQPIGLAYPLGSSLQHHVDNTGNWVVLFSFGLTCDFHVAGLTVEIESGDALVFNGGPAHQVMHGLDKVHERPTYKGKQLDLPNGMLEQLNETRVSIQVRQV